MNENEMGYRGSKSLLIKKQSVKEQRVDGSYFINKILMKLRCTLTGFERNYQTKISSKQFVIHNKIFCTNSQYKNLLFLKNCDTSSILPVSSLVLPKGKDNPKGHLGEQPCCCSSI
jgi:competence CoiA-like predicted nuclease